MQPVNERRSAKASLTRGRPNDLNVQPCAPRPFRSLYVKDRMRHPRREPAPTSASKGLLIVILSGSVYCSAFGLYRPEVTVRHRLPIDPVGKVLVRRVKKPPIGLT